MLNLKTEKFKIIKILTRVYYFSMYPNSSRTTIKISQWLGILFSFYREESNNDITILARSQKLIGIFLMSTLKISATARAPLPR